jgi:hypothetical protein
VAASNEDDIASLLFSGSDTPRERYFLLGTDGREVIAFWHSKNAIMARIIEDNALAQACKEYLRRHRYPTFASVEAVYAYAARQGWPGWEQYKLA